MDFFVLPFDSFSPTFIECIISFYLLSYILYTITICNVQKSGYLINMSSGNFFAQILFIGLILNFFTNSNINHLSFNGILFYGIHSNFFQLTILIVSLIIIAISRYFLITFKIFQFEYNLLLLFSVLGLSILCFSFDILLLYLAIELQSLAFYLLATFQWNSDYSIEAGLKYFVLGSFSSCLLLFGFSLIYLVLGSTSFEVIKNLLDEPFCFNIILVAIMFISAALLFKIGAAPFHMWLCDVYEGSLTSVTLFFAIVPKLVLFYLFLKVFFVVFLSQQIFWGNLFLISGFLSVFIASIGALFQKKLKRLVAFSAISHSGFMLLAISCCSLESIKAFSFYIIIYIIMSFALFSTIILSISNSQFLKYLINWSFFSKRNYVIAISFSLILFSLAGIPPLSGFYSKLLVFISLLNESKYVITVLIALLSSVACFYYIRLIKIFFFVGNLKNGFWVSSNSREIEFFYATSLLILVFFLIHPDSLFLTSSLLSFTFLI